MTNIITYGAVILASFLLGSFPTAFLVVRQIKGIDIRTVGSQNVGATNAGRILGNQWFIIIMLIDALKGAAACFLMMIVMNISGLHEGDFFSKGVPIILAGTAAILGHTFTPWLGFKGGKGVATAFGVFLVLATVTTLICAVIFSLIVLLTRYISLGSILAALTLPVGIFIELRPFHHDGKNAIVLFFIAVAIAIFITVKHRDNITRLLQGKENKFGQSKE
jgi:acyl phosphate:glycerol-3-phosphate acyltransferase